MDAGSDGVARWRRVADGIRAAIGDGSIVERLPAESDLAARFGVNRHTVRRAMAALTADGLVRTERGRGSFVSGAAPRLVYEVGPRTRFGENVLAQARRPSSCLLASRIEGVDVRLADMLDIPAGDPVVRFETLQEVDGIAVSIATHWISAMRFPGFVDAFAGSGSITEAFRAAGVADYRRGETRLTAERTTPSDAAHLGGAPDGLVLVARAIDVDLAGNPIQVLRTRFHAERMELIVRH